MMQTFLSEERMERESQIVHTSGTCTIYHVGHLLKLVCDSRLKNPFFSRRFFLVPHKACLTGFLGICFMNQL